MNPTLFSTTLALAAAEIPVATIAVVGAFALPIIAIVLSTVRKTVETKAREESRREIAAYVAEGSISPDDAAKLIAAGKRPTDAKHSCSSC